MKEKFLLMNTMSLRTPTNKVNSCLCRSKQKLNWNKSTGRTIILVRRNLISSSREKSWKIWTKQTEIRNLKRNVRKWWEVNFTKEEKYCISKLAEIVYSISFDYFIILINIIKYAYSWKILFHYGIIWV